MTPPTLVLSVAASVLLLLSTPCWSAGEEPPPQTPSLPSLPETADPAVAGVIAQARGLVDAGRFGEALAVLAPLFRGETVDGKALFLYGLAATGAAKRPGLEDDERDALLDAAIGAFHAMLIEQPGLVRVRLELARAFFLKGEDSLARRHFEQVLAGNPPAAVASNIRRFLLQIRARRRWSLNVGFALAPDSNIGGGSKERTIEIAGLPFRIDDADELSRSGVGVVVWGGAEYQYPLSDRVRLRAGADLSRREYAGSRFDDTFASVRVGPRIAVSGRRTEASVLATASQRWAGTVKDFHALGGRLEVGHRLGRSVTVNGRLSWEDRHYRTRTSLDGAALDLSLSGSWVVAPTVRADVSLGYGHERPARMHQRHEGVRVGAGVSVLLPRGFTVGGGGEYRWTHYEPGWLQVPGFGARRDRTWNVRASVFNRGFTLFGFSPELSVVHEVRETNAQAADYRRTRGELRFVRQF